MPAAPVHVKNLVGRCITNCRRGRAARLAQGTQWGATAGTITRTSRCAGEAQLRRRAAEDDAASSSDSGSKPTWDQPIFGVPMAPEEIWQGFQHEHRKAFMADMMEPKTDMLEAALQLAAEDDAVSTKSTVALPVDAYSKRMESLVTQLRYDINGKQPDLSTPSQTLEYISRFLFDTMGYKVAEKPLELYSPYRIYMHRVLAQRCGTPEAIAVVLCSLLSRAAQAGLVSELQPEVGIPAPGNIPILRQAGTDQHGDADVQWCSPRDCVLACLEFLKRYFWSWEWDTEACESFMLPARAFLGDFGRAGMGSGVVGVMQITGRPFGDLNMALLATERLALLHGRCEGGAVGARHVRDMAVLLLHLKRYSEAVPALAEYQSWIDSTSAADLEATIESMQRSSECSVAISKEEADVVQQLRSKAETEAAKQALESTFSSS